MKINLKPEQYYTQHNNVWDDKNTAIHESLVACFPTARAMFYEGNNIPYSNPSSYSADDYFMSLLRSDTAYAFAYARYSEIAEKAPPNEIHYMYPEWLDKVVCGKKVSVFKESGLTFKSALNFMDKGTVLMVSGKFPEARLNGHIFCIIGYKDKSTLYLADPYGDFHTNYKSKKGYKIEMNEAEFNEILKWGKTKAYHAPL